MARSSRKHRQSRGACADAGNLDKGIEIALDVEPLVHEVKTLLNAATLISRISDP
jgi:hypothetical protein